MESEFAKLPRLLRVREVERLVGIESWRLYELIARGQGPDHLRIGQTIRVSEHALVRWIAEREEIQKEPRSKLKGRA